MMRLAAVVLVGVVAACAIVGCDGGAGNYSSPTATFTSMWDAAKAGNKNAMMACFSDECRTKIAEMDKLIAGLPKEAKESQKDITEEMMSKAKTAKVEFGGEKIDGDKGTLETTIDGKKETVQFIKQGGNWKVHIPELAAINIEQMKAMFELMKNMSKGMMKGMGEGMKDILK